MTLRILRWRRFLAIGNAEKKKSMIAVFILRKKQGSLLIHPMSSLYMHNKEAREYNEESTKIKSDKDAEAFLEQDLTEYIDLKNFTQVRFEFLPKTKKVNIRFPEQLLDAVREKAKREGMSYQKYIRRAVEKSLTTH